MGEQTIKDLCKPLSAKVMPKSAHMSEGGLLKTDAEMLAIQRRQQKKGKAKNLEK